MRGSQANQSFNRFTRQQPLLGQLDAVINRVTQQMGKGCLELFQYVAVNLGFFAFNFQAYLLAQAAAQLAARGEAITEASLNGAMALAHVPDPDLFIRTGGEHRISNFLLWQCAYSELFFSPSLWPDFDDAALDAALHDYASRERRFGKTSAQVQTTAASSMRT